MLPTQSRNRGIGAFATSQCGLFPIISPQCRPQILYMYIVGIYIYRGAHITMNLDLLGGLRPN